MNEEIELSQIIAILRRHLRVIIILPMISMMVAAVLVFFIITPVYEASTTLVVGKDETSNTHAGLAYQDVLLNQQLVKTYGEIAKSRSVAEEVIQRLGVNLGLEQLQKKIRVSLVDGTQIIRLSTIDIDPVAAQSIANTTAMVFVKRVPELIKLNNVTVVDQAVTPVLPVKPGKLLTIAAAAVAGLMVAVGVVVLHAYLDNTIKDKVAAEELLGLPVIGMIPKID